MIVEVLYSDESTIKTTLEDAHKLPREHVQAITLSQDGIRYRQKLGVDYYYLHEDDQYIDLNGWDDEDTRVIDKANLGVKCDRGRPLGLPDDCLIFVGEQLSEDKWKKARKLISEMG